jgi:hypothetical protein
MTLSLYTSEENINFPLLKETYKVAFERLKLDVSQSGYSSDVKGHLNLLLHKMSSDICSILMLVEHDLILQAYSIISSTTESWYYFYALEKGTLQPFDWMKHNKKKLNLILKEAELGNDSDSKIPMKDIRQKISKKIEKWLESIDTPTERIEETHKHLERTCLVSYRLGSEIRHSNPNTLLTMSSDCDLEENRNKLITACSVMLQYLVLSHDIFDNSILKPLDEVMIPYAEQLKKSRA